MLDSNQKLYKWGPLSACPLFMYFTIEPAFKPLKELLGVCYPTSDIIFKDNKVLWVLNLNQFIKHSQEFVKSNIYSKADLENYKKIWKTRTEPLVEYMNFLEIDGFQDNSFEKFCNLYKSWWTHAISIELVSTTIESELGRLLREKITNEKDFNEAFALLSSPDRPSFYLEEQRDLIRIARLYGQKRNSAMELHQRKYYWIYNSYLKSKMLTQKYFENELSKIENNQKDSKQTLDEIEGYPAKVRTEKKELLLRIYADAKLRKMSELVSYFAKLQDTRKAINFRGDHFLQLFAETYSRETGVPVNDLKLLTHEEIKTPSKKLILNRKICWALDCNEKRITSSAGKSAWNQYQVYFSTSNATQNTIHGILASSGNNHYFRGIARIIDSVDQIDELQEGEVLVTKMTSPDFVIGMRKAGAIVTDVGGMLCHAAIVSRELGKPCVVGTEIATKVIKTGDVVELHCLRGTIKLQKSS